MVGNAFEYVHWETVSIIQACTASSSGTAYFCLEVRRNSGEQPRMQSSIWYSAPMRSRASLASGDFTVGSVALSALAGAARSCRPMLDIELLR